jgi:hypothetical protein
MRQPGWIERVARQVACFPSILVLPDGSRFPVTITNVSEGGCQIACDETLPIGASVALKIAGKQIDAEVRWSIDGKAGLRLREE